MKRDQLDEAIRKKREEMIKKGLEKGLLCEETIICSQELDKLLNAYHRFHSKPVHAEHINLCYKFIGYLRNRIHKYMVSA